jgi:hypothetical protein
MKGNKDAIRLVQMLHQIVDVWDNLIDRDEVVADDEINEMMWNALVGIPGNQFYKDLGHLLRPVIEVGIINWKLANRMEAVEGRSREIAHVIRYSIGDVVIYMMRLIGGEGWASGDVGVEMRMRIQRDGLASFNAEMNSKYPKEN